MLRMIEHLPIADGPSRADRVRAALPAVKVLLAEVWDECAEWIDAHDPDVEDARAANPYRPSRPAAGDP